MGQPHKSLRETSPSRTFLESPWLWLAPVLVPFILFMLGPIIQVVRLSFYQWDWFESIPRGFGQYRRLMRDPEFFRAMRHTIIFAAAVVPSWIFLTLFIAAA
ncbi:sugar ABC transporter permease, partial [Candidatus Sumerlaeota bacterium]|nr:sugar ABC transporter permease [Candidatus Sumerlaeota bacterium]